MTLNELIAAIHVSPLSHSGLGVPAPIWQITSILRALGNVITAELHGGGEAPLPGLGKLKAETRAARTGRNPATGAALEIPARKTAKFVPAKALKDALA